MITRRAIHAKYLRFTGLYVVLGLTLLLVGGCGPEPATPPEGATAMEEAAPAVEAAPPAATEAPPARTDTGESIEASATLFATLKVVDLAGEPLPGMAPIVTRQPNAFDPPVATGTSTGLDGQGSIRFKTDEHLYLRAWDPALRYFPNNFFEVLPGGTSIDGELVIQMVPSMNLEAQFFLPDGEPARDQAVALMLFHPSRGPWWPAEARTDAEGVAAFPNLPAGEYVLRFKAESGPRLERGQTPLPPASTVNFGALTLEE